MAVDLDKCVSSLKKKFKTVSKVSDSETFGEVISTGNKALDLVLDGGIPFGAMAEFAGFNSSGKSLFLQMILANAQKQFDVVGIITDRENAFTDKRAQELGIDTNNVLVAKPGDVPQAIDAFAFIEESVNLIRKENPKQKIIIIIDSISAFDKDVAMEKSDQGRKAKQIHEGLRKFFTLMDTNTMLLIANQKTYKIGVCLSYKSSIVLEDGTKEWIGKIVNHKESKKVLSYNFETNKIESKNITNWFNNGSEKECFYSLETKCINKNGKSNLSYITGDHIIPTTSGEFSIKELYNKFIENKELPNIFGLGYEYFTEDQHNIILGSVLGDGNIRYDKNSLNGTFRIGHGYKQKGYCQWKANSFSAKLKEYKNSVEFSSPPSRELDIYKTIITKKGAVYIPDTFIEKLNYKVIAIWYMDDGSFSGCYEKWGAGKCKICCKLLNEEQLNKINNQFIKLGIGCTSYKEGKGFLWSGKNSKDFQKAISEYIHPSMRYKIKDCEENKQFNWEVVQEPPKYKLYDYPIIGFSTKIPDRQHNIKFDIEVEDNHNFFCNGVLVNNCFGDPTTTTGGEGTKYYSSIRVTLGEGKKIIDAKRGNEVTGVWIPIHIDKSRMGACHRVITIPFYYKEGIPYLGGYAHLLADRGYISPNNKQGWKSCKMHTFTYKDSKRANGLKMEEFLEKYPELVFDEYPDWGGDVTTDNDSDDDEENTEKGEE